MKKLYYLALSLVALAVVSVSCSKDDDDKKTFEVADLIGEYVVVGGDNFTACPDGDNQLFEITETSIMEGQTTEDGCAVEDSYASLDYTFTGGNTFDCIIGTYKVTSFDGTRLNLEIGTPLFPGVTTKMSMDKQ